MVSHAQSRHHTRDNARVQEATFVLPQQTTFDKIHARNTTATTPTTYTPIPRRLMYSNHRIPFNNTETGQSAADSKLDSQQHTTAYPFSSSNYPVDWGMQFADHDNNSFGSGYLATRNNKANLSVFRGHQRNISESSINSVGPSSPFTSSFSNPYIASIETSPASRPHSHSYSNFDEASASHTSHIKEEQSYQYQLGYTPSQLSHTPAVHLDMAHMLMDQHNAVADDMPEFSHSSRQSVSSRGQDSPSTPPVDSQATADDDQEQHAERPALYKINTNDYRPTAPRVELFRTESAAAADELYNPDFAQPSTQRLQPQPQHSDNAGYLSPSRSLIQDRIRSANSARSQSPHQQTSGREKSPFRPGSPLAPADGKNDHGFKSPSTFFSSAADARRQQIEEASAQEVLRHNIKHPTLRREPTKTMSPRDAVLDYDVNADTEMPLFPEAMPQGFEKHAGANEFFTNNYLNGPGQAFDKRQQPSNMGAFRPQRATDQHANHEEFKFLQPPQPQPQPQPHSHQQPATSSPQVPNNPYANPAYRPAGFEHTPDFPAHLTSMESSVSDAPISSQGSLTSDPLQRPADTSAATGGYTCTFHNCPDRFDSPAKLQKHKREFHGTHHAAQASRDHSAALSSVPTPTAPSPLRASVSPDPSHDGSEGSVGSVGSGMTSAALAARNSQAGPHKCTRINPSTGKACNTIFSRPYDLTRHEDTIHNRQKVKVHCQYCREEKTFSRNDALTRHMRVVHPDVQWDVKRGSRGARDFSS